MKATAQEKIVVAKEGIATESSDGVSIESNISELYYLVESRRCFSEVAKIINAKNHKISKQLVIISNLQKRIRSLENTNAQKGSNNECWDAIAGDKLNLLTPEELEKRNRELKEKNLKNSVN